MNGLGFLIWQLANMPPVDKLIPALQAIGLNVWRTRCKAWAVRR